MAGKEFVQLAEVSVILRDLGISDVDGQSDHRAGNPRLFCHKLIKSSTHRDQLLLLTQETFSTILEIHHFWCNFSRLSRSKLTKFIQFSFVPWVAAAEMLVPCSTSFGFRSVDG